MSCLQRLLAVRLGVPPQPGRLRIRLARRGNGCARARRIRRFMPTGLCGIPKRGLELAPFSRLGGGQEGRRERTPRMIERPLPGGLRNR